MNSLYKLGGTVDAWGCKIAYCVCDDDELDAKLADGWVTHPYLLEIYNSEEAKEYRAENAPKKAPKAKKSDDAEAE